ncbi:unnamed protein product [Gemmata massiliana]|uniref:Uncharacterized protein n=1 Tax=Gemmata massiliana TaxID=1210884 RepID=A0A6P2CW84_9BACT|nr:hypothetical protein [Gemmata massiliana]VTR93241.1 unnamed protein product [Gemmata massiliana]
MCAFIGPQHLTLILVTLLTLVPVVRGDDPPAPKKPAEECIVGVLQFKSRRADFAGIDVGKEFGARKYIPGHPNTPDRATWGFDTLPQSVKAPPDDTVPAKLTCSVFRTGKNTPPGVQVVVRAVSHTCPQSPDPVRGDWQWAGDKAGAAQKERYAKDLAAYKDKKIDPGAEKPDAATWKAANELAEKYGYYEITLPKVFDFDETTVNLPAGLFRNALKNKPEANADGTPKRPLVSIYVKCETTGVLIGMTDADLYLYPPKPAPK